MVDKDKNNKYIRKNNKKYFEELKNTRPIIKKLKTLKLYKK